MGMFFFFGGNCSTFRLWPTKGIFGGNVNTGVAVSKYNNNIFSVIIFFFFTTLSGVIDNISQYFNSMLTIQIDRLFIKNIGQTQRMF